MRVACITGLSVDAGALFLSDIQHVESHWKDYDSIISICQHFELPQDLRRTSNYCAFPMDDAPLSTPDAAKRAAHVIRKASRAVIRELRQGKTVLLHCAAGQNRSAAVAVTVLKHYYPEMGVTELIERIKKDKADAGYNVGQWATLTNDSFCQLLCASL